MIINKKVNPCGITKFNLYFKKIKIFSIFSSNGARGGLEPARYRYRWILSPLRLPISPPGIACILYTILFAFARKK